MLSPLPADYEKRGQAVLVDNTVENALMERPRTDELFAQLKSDLADSPVSRNVIVAEFENARRYSQATIALALFAIMAHAFPRMSNWYEKHGTLVRKDGLANPSDPIAVGGRWFSESMGCVLDGLRAANDPLIQHLQQSKTEVNEAYEKWKSTPIGQNSWPEVAEGQEMGRVEVSLLDNVELASNHLAAFAVYASVFRGVRRPEHAHTLAELTRAEAVPRLTWWSTAHRHLARTEENVRCLKEGRPDEAKFFAPFQATTLLTYESIVHLGLEATVRKFTDRAMAGSLSSSAFLQHPVSFVS